MRVPEAQPRAGGLDERGGGWHLALPSRGGQEFRYAESWMGSSQFRPLSLSLPAGLGTNALQGAAGGKLVREICCLIAAGDSPARSATLSGRQLQRLRSAHRSGAAIAPGRCKCCHSMKNPAGLIASRRPRCPSRRSGRCCECRSPPLPGSSGPAAEELAALRGLGLKRRRPCSTTHLFKLPMGTVGNGKISARSPEPPPEAKYENQGGPGLGGDQCLSGPILSCRRSAHVFWPVRHGPAADPSAGVPPSGRRARLLRAGAGAAPATGSPLDSGRFARLRRYLRQALRDCRGRSHPAAGGGVSRSC